MEVVRYSGLKAFEKDAKKRLKDGWRVHSQSAIPGHVNVGRTLTKTILTGGLGLILGGPSRKKETIIVSWTR